MQAVPRTLEPGVGLCLSAVSLVLLKKFCRDSPRLSDLRPGNGCARAKLG